MSIFWAPNARIVVSPDRVVESCENTGDLETPSSRLMDLDEAR